MFRDRRGGVLVYTAIALPVLLGTAGLSVDVASWHAHKRIIQSAADSAAVAGALEVLRTGGNNQIQQAAQLDAADNGYSAAQGDTITVNYPPTTGSRAGALNSVEVIVQRPLPLFLAGLFLDAPPAAFARAVAVADINDTCVWALDRTSRSAVTVSGGAQVNFQCGMLVNSDDPEALTQTGETSCLRAKKVKVVGGFDGNCIVPGPWTAASPVEDPLEALQPPAYSGCDHTSKYKVNGGDSITLSPGVYCGDIEVLSNGSVTFEPGVYVLDSAGLKIAAQANVTGTGVTFYLSDNAKTSDNVSIQGGANVTMTAPTSGDMAGVLFYQDRYASPNISHEVAGGASMDLDGIVYFPKQHVKFAGGTSVGHSSTMIIANTIAFSGNASLGGFQGSAASSNRLLISAVIVE
ncbi:MAG: pilus assembly protein TadG-related protein [Alphaproteobacteria bacterium]